MPEPEKCPCGKDAHPAYGYRCEDCWADRNQYGDAELRLLRRPRGREEGTYKSMNKVTGVVRPSKITHYI